MNIGWDLHMYSWNIATYTQKTLLGKYKKLVDTNNKQKSWGKMLY